MHVHAHLNDELSDFTAMEIQSCMTSGSGQDSIA